MEEGVGVEELIDALIEREGGYVNHSADKGGPTCFGITEAVARAQGYSGSMRELPREDAALIYKRLYWLRPRFAEVAKRSSKVAAELFDTGVNMGPALAATFLQRALTALNRNGSDYSDLVSHQLGSLASHKGMPHCVAARARGTPGRALPPPCRAATGPCASSRQSIQTPARADDMCVKQA